MRVAVYTFSFNNNDDVRDWIAATNEAEYRLVFDLGSTDESGKLLEDNGCIVIHGCDSSVRSDDALNATLAMMPNDIDLCFRVDMHERPQPGWRGLLDESSTADVQTVLINKINPVHRYLEPRIHRRFGFRWSGPGQETLIWRGWPKQMESTASKIVISQFGEIDYQRMIATCKEGADENLSHRIFRYAEALLRTGYLDLGLAEINRYTVSNGAAPDHIAFLWRLAATIDDVSAYGYLLEAQKAYSCASNYLAFAEWHFRNKEWGQAYNCCQYALSLMRSNPQKILYHTDDPRIRQSVLHDLAATAALNLWDFEAAYGHAVEALRRSPGDTVLLRQLNLIQSKINEGATLDPDMQVTIDPVSEPKLAVEVIRGVFDNRIDKAMEAAS